MSSSPLRAPGALGGGHPVVLDRRLRELALVTVSFVIPALLALAITVELPAHDLPEVLGAIAIVIGIVALILSSRLEVTVVLLGLYLGLLDGPIKLTSGAREVGSAIPNILILAVCLGAVLRISAKRERVRMPALSAWVFAFIGVVAIEAFNPNTHGLLKVAAGFRQQLQWVPFFFFAYYLMRSKRRFRQLFLIVGVLACANGVIAIYQTELSPTQLGSWGPGYHNLLFIPEGGKGGARIFASEGEARVRPPGLGSDAGFSGAVGQIALPFGLALLATMRRRKWIAVVLCFGALLGSLAGEGRTQVIGTVLGVLAFAGLAVLAGRRPTRALASLLAVVVLAIPAGAVLIGALRSGTFTRYESIEVGSSSTTLHKSAAWELIPHYLHAAPFGFGLGSVGPVAAVGGKNGPLLEGHGVSSETQFNFIVNELGAPGLIVFTALFLYALALIVRGMRRVRDPDLAIMLAGAFAPFVVLLVESTSGAFTNSAIAGPYFWFAIGTAAYWFAGPGRSSRMMRKAPSVSAPLVPAAAI
jgi:hypothetical protein